MALLIVTSSADECLAMYWCYVIMYTSVNSSLKMCVLTVMHPLMLGSLRVGATSLCAPRLCVAEVIQVTRKKNSKCSALTSSFSGNLANNLWFLPELGFQCLWSFYLLFVVSQIFNQNNWVHRSDILCFICGFKWIK